MSESVKFTPEREVRFAVVMYGGVSLAIYINGVAQELLSLVRATAPKTVDEKSPDFGDALLGATKEELTGSLAVYRKLGQYLEDKNAKLKETTPTRDPIRTRFVVDVISGTSAGGINGVFLAKALARDQDMEGLKRLWLSEGDLDKLLNDKGSLAGLTGFKVGEPQTSLLNSQRMYRKLLEALDTMDRKDKGRPETEVSPLVGELDLFITTTDIEGIPLPIMLSDEVVYERRFKNVFHLRYATEESTGSARDDFIKGNDPFLAFAARCTSSFPFAFEAMCLQDIAESTKNFAPYIDKSETAAWDTFFGAYLRNALYDINQKARGGNGPKLPRDAKGKEDLVQAKTDLRKAFRNRAFGDGGYLDNKPFSYATSMLMRRSADCIVSRKLLYVEPSPQHPELMPTDPEKPDFAQNIRAAVFDLPRQETIREDIERLYERNEMIERLTVFAKHVDEDMLLRKQRSMTHPEFARAGLKQMIELYGVSYGAYHRLKIEEITTLLATLIARASGHDPTSDAADAILELVAAWRRSQFHPLKANERTDPADKAKQTENQFLLDFDIRYKLRRFGFLNRRVNLLASLDDDAKALLDACFKQLPLWPAALTATEVATSYRVEFVTELNRIKKEMLAPEMKSARSAEEKLVVPTSDTGKLIYGAIGKLQIAWTDLALILSCDEGVEREKKAESILKLAGREKALSNLATIISDAFDCKTDPTKPSKKIRTPGAFAARLSLAHYRRHFVHYDLVTYPVQYGTGAGEANTVDVFRVSPEDATELMNERKGDRRKLAGTALMSFGAFLDEGWRRNDMLWGRLDGAERLITALLPDKTDEGLRKDLIKEAHMSILDEVLKAGDLKTICQLVGSSLAGRAPSSDSESALEAFVRKEFSTQDLTESMQSALYRCLDEPEKIWKYYNKDYEVNRDIKPETALQLISRATNITGKMLQGLSENYRYKSGSRAAAWISRLGLVFWNLVAVAVPDTLRNLFFRHALGLLYLFDFALIFGGILFNAPVKALGWEMLGFTIVLHLVTATLADYMSGKRIGLWIARIVIAVGLIGLIICGALYLSERWLKLTPSGEARLAAIVAGTLLIAVAAGEVFRSRRGKTGKIDKEKQNVSADK